MRVTEYFWYVLLGFNRFEHGSVGLNYELAALFFSNGVGDLEIFKNLGICFVS